MRITQQPPQATNSPPSTPSSIEVQTTSSSAVGKHQASMVQAVRTNHIPRIHPIQNPILQYIMPMLSHTVYAGTALGFKLLLICTASKLILDKPSQAHLARFKQDKKTRIFLPNHVSNLDALVMTLLLVSRGLGRVSALYNPKFDRNLFTRLLAFFAGHIKAPSTREHLGTAATEQQKAEAYQKIVAQLSDQALVRLTYFYFVNLMIFLEGTRSRVPSSNPDNPFKMLTAQTGALEALINATRRLAPENIEIVPVGLKYRGRLTCEVRIGNPIAIETAMQDIEKMGGIRAYANSLMKDRIAPLSGQELATPDEIQEARRLRYEKQQHQRGKTPTMLKYRSAAIAVAVLVSAYMLANQINTPQQT